MSVNSLSSSIKILLFVLFQNYPKQALLRFRNYYFLYCYQIIRSNRAQIRLLSIGCSQLQLQHNPITSLCDRDMHHCHPHLQYIIYNISHTFQGLKLLLPFHQYIGAFSLHKIANLGICVAFLQIKAPM